MTESDFAAHLVDDQYCAPAHEAEPRCTLTTGTCYCTGRAGCLAANEDAFDEPEPARYTRRA